MKTRTFDPPDPCGFVGRAAVIVEVAPNQWAQVIIEVDHGNPAGAVTIDIDYDYDEDPPVAAAFSEPLRYIRSQPARVDIRLTGKLISREETSRPGWATDQPEITARREPPGAP